MNVERSVLLTLAVAVACLVVMGLVLGFVVLLDPVP